jgi:hypothetical protein
MAITLISHKLPYSWNYILNDWGCAIVSFMMNIRIFISYLKKIKYFWQGGKQVIYVHHGMNFLGHLRVVQLPQIVRNCTLVLFSDRSRHPLGGSTGVQFHVGGHSLLCSNWGVSELATYNTWPWQGARAPTMAPQELLNAEYWIRMDLSALLARKFSL